ncbi:LysR family transcriptional regulator [Paraburkholderia rhizosphaerae]|uniref:LysR family malonate utilization transcriptional regulator n=1 Tax=Paraburkholderia rhizosphaerae TaxID=480658 RepID=A0A4V3HCY9_9BURK|nr:LysR family transcriptional regulator [Paraburkholderia rhizosphaerae]TDY38974.1 LysR family malonate utilization transcriptional regulator [Paraburkholderia rhizosphaerae]
MGERIDEEISFRRLEVLLAFMEGGSLGKAAELLDVSTVSVHRALHSLEKGMRCKLFDHQGRQLIPTDAARALASTAREVLTAMSVGIRTAREVAGYSSSVLRLGSLYSLTLGTVPAIIAELKARGTELEVDLTLGSNTELIERLTQGTLDAALLAVPELGAEFQSIQLFEDEIYFAAPAGSRYADLESIDLQTCSHEPFVSLDEGFATYHGFHHAFHLAGATPTVIMTVGDVFSLTSLVSGGVGYTLLPGRVRGLLNDKVRFIPLSDRFRMKQKIGLIFSSIRERDPTLLKLGVACRAIARARSRNQTGS